MSLLFRLSLCGAMLLPAAASGQLAKDVQASRRASSDAVCELLFEQYILGAKVPTDEVNAAVLLVATRGRTNGFWRTVLAQFERSLQTGDSQTRRHTLAVLSKMLADDGNTRWILKRPSLRESSAAVLAIGLGDEVLEAVMRMARARHAGPHALDAYVVAVRNAHDPRCKALLADILQSDDVPADARFHAAVGLAELGDGAGVEWMIAQADHLAGYGFLVHARHFDSPRGGLAESCRLALADLTGQPAIWTKTEWRQWWAENRDGYSPANLVHLRIP